MQRILALRKALMERVDCGESYRNLLSAHLGIDVDRCVVSTAEHIAPFNHVSAVSFIFPQLLIPAEAGAWVDTILVLGCSLIPLDNSDYPRGFLLPGGDEGPTRRVNLWPHRLRKAVPLLLPARRFTGLPELDTLLAQHAYLAEPLRGEVGVGSYAGQLATVMEAMTTRWPAAANRPQVRVLPGEEVAAAVLIDLLRDSDPFLCRLIEDGQVRASLRQMLDGVYCAWCEERGSFLFWAAAPDNSGQVVRVTEQDGCLVGHNVSIPLKRDAIAEALATKRLLPGVALALLAVSWLPGVPIAGGPKQKRYWECMIEAFNQFVPGAHSRPHWLSQFGYGELTWDETSALIGVPEIGTGLSLAEKHLCCDAARATISKSTNRPPQNARYA